MKTGKLLGKVMARLETFDIEVDKLVVEGNRITLEDAVVLVNNTEDGYAGNFRVRTYDAVKRFDSCYDVLDALVDELLYISNYHSGATVEKQDNKYMLVPHRKLKGAFHLLDSNTFEMSQDYKYRTDLYKEGYTIIE